MRIPAALRAPSPRAILAIGFAAFLVYAFPGYMSTDSVRQLWEGRTLRLGDAHPPVMAVEWKLLDLLISGPLLMLLVQGALFLGGLYAILRRAMSARVAALGAVALFLFPPILTTMAVIWKDSQMAAYLMAGLPALLAERRRTRIIGVALVSAACAMRYNAFGAGVPLIGLLFVWRPGLGFWKRYAISGAAAIAAVVVAFGVNRALTVEPAYMTPAFADIVGVLDYTDDRSDEDLRQVLRDTPLRVTTGIQARARALYSPRNSYDVSHGPDRMFDPPATQRERDALTRAWKEIVRSDWHAYLQYRVAGFVELLGLSDELLWSPVYVKFTEAEDQKTTAQHDAAPSTLQQWLQDRLTDLSVETPLFRPYLYVLLALALLVLCCRDRLTLALFTSGLLYELSFLPTAGTPDFRYSHWMIACTCLAAVLLFAQRWRAGRA